MVFVFWNRSNPDKIWFLLLYGHDIPYTWTPQNNQINEFILSICLFEICIKLKKYTNILCVWKSQLSLDYVYFHHAQIFTTNNYMRLLHDFVQISLMFFKKRKLKPFDLNRISLTMKSEIMTLKIKLKKIIWIYFFHNTLWIGLQTITLNTSNTKYCFFHRTLKDIKKFEQN